MISRLDFRYPSQFGENGTLRAVKELATDDNQPANNDQEPIIPDRTVNYRKCILPFVLGVALMLAGIIMRKSHFRVRLKVDGPLTQIVRSTLYEKERPYLNFKPVFFHRLSMLSRLYRPV